MAYDKPNRIKYSFGNFDFGGAADETFSIFGPKGKAGRLWDYGVEGSIEIFNGNTVTPKIAVGTTGDPDAYGDELDLNALADNHAKSVRSTYLEAEAGFRTLMDVTANGREIAANEEVVVTCTGATGSPTGQAVPYAIIDWMD